MIGHYIDGQEVSGLDARTLPIDCPADGSIIGQLEMASVETARKVIASSENAHKTWSEVNPQRRARVLNKFVQIVTDNIEELATVMSREHGKTIPDSKAEIQRGLEAVEFACGIPHLMKGEFSDSVGPGIDTLSMRQPLGVVAGITPFNFPVMIPLWMMGNAIATGNTFILKPSERDPSASMMLAKWMTEAGAPEGVLNVLNGDVEVVNELLTNPVVKAISFVGSSDIAEKVYEKGAAHGKKVQAMGGAKNHMIVLPDADMENVANSLLGAAYGSAGERCMAISVVVPVGEGTAEKLLDVLVPKIKALKVGPSLEPSSDFGPLISAPHKARVEQFIAEGIEQGAELVVDGRNTSIEGYEDGYYLGSCLFDKVTPEMSIYIEEIFGPVLSIVRAKNFEEAVALPSTHQYGNGVAIFTRNGGAAREFAKKVQAGMVGINVPLPVPLSFYTFGGWKRSAYGGFNQHGMDGVRFFTKAKTVVTRWPNDIQGAEFVMPTM